jgi:hypothetical protein
VKVYHLETGVWTLKKEYTKSTSFGTQVCLNDAGTRLFVSDPNDNSNTGKVYVYDYSGSAWGNSETHSWVSPDGNANDYFGGVAGKGIDCNSDGTRLLVVTGYVGIKKAWIFDHNGSSWNTLATKTWTSSSASWGTTCALNDTGDRAFIGYEAGVDIFHYDGSNWPTSATKNYTGSSNFGMSLTINGAGTRLLVGDYGYSSGNGQTTLYDYTGSAWNTLATQVINGSNGTNTYYGHGINMSRDGKRYLVSTHNSSTYFSNGGYVELMEDTSGTGTFSLKQTFESDAASENMGSYQFQEGLCLDENGYSAVILSTGTDVSRFYSAPAPQSYLTSVTTDILAFHYGDFDDVYGDGTVSNAAGNGHVYADTPTGTYSWGSLGSVSNTATGTTYTWTPPGNGVTGDVLMVAGGGGGGGGVVNDTWGEGGGGGETMLLVNYNVSDSHTITIGNGGTSSGASNARGDNGNETIFNTYTVNPGLGGGRPTQTDGGTSGSGNPGGFGSSSNYRAGGGGGDSQPGSDGNGGDGSDYSSIFGTTYGDTNYPGWFGGGGAGQFGNSTGYIGYGGKGGGASISASDGGTGQPGQKHTGGGGAERSGGNGGSGIVLIKYTLPVTPSLTYDGYNKLTTIGGYADQTLYKDSNSWSLGTASNVYIAESGEYIYFTRDAATAFLANVTVGSVTDAPLGNILSFSKGTTTWPAQLIITDLQILDVDDNVLNIQYFYFPFTNGGSTTNKEYIYSTDTDFSSITNGTYTTDDSAYINSDTYRVLELGSTTANSYDPNTVFMQVKAFDGQADIAKVRIIYSRANYKQNVIISLGTRTYETSTGSGNSGLDETYTLTDSPLYASLTYDGLNSLKVTGAEASSYITYKAYESNKFLACGTDLTTYPLSKTGNYKAEIAGSTTFTLTSNVLVPATNIVPLYQYPPTDGTTSGITETVTADVNSIWTISSAGYGNGLYHAQADVAATSTSVTAYHAFDSNLTAGFETTSSTTGTLKIQLPSATTIHKYVVWPKAADGNRPKYWIIEGSQDTATWYTIHTVTNSPPSLSGDVYEISSPAAYVYYRINVLANNGGTGLEIAELALYGDVAFSITFSDGWVTTNGANTIPIGTSYTLPTYTSSLPVTVTGASDLDVNTAGTYKVVYTSIGIDELARRVVRRFVVEYPTIAFHYAGFVATDYNSTYATKEAAAADGFVYADTPDGTYSWGTLTVTSNTTSNTQYTWTPVTAITADVLMVAGGGSGGSYNTGGGGAGGLVYKQNESISTGEKTIIVGNGGPTRSNPTNSSKTNNRAGARGEDTVFSTYIAIGGGANYPYSTGNQIIKGGSGGAGASSVGDALQPTSVTGGFGNIGGTDDSDRAGGGGGGAGTPGEDGQQDVQAGNGGDGRYYGDIFKDIYGDNGWFAGGGGGGWSSYWHPSTAASLGGKGGGGSGVGTFNVGGHGIKHTGGGGGGTGQDSLTTPDIDLGGEGGSGIVLVKRTA